MKRTSDEVRADFLSDLIALMEKHNAEMEVGELDYGLCAIEIHVGGNAGDRSADLIVTSVTKAGAN